MIDRLKAERVTSGLSIEAVEEAYLYPIFKNLNLVEAHYNAILQNSLMYQRVLFKHNIIKKISLSPVIVINNNWTGQQVVEIVHDIHDKLIENIEVKNNKLEYLLSHIAGGNAHEI